MTTSPVVHLTPDELGDEDTSTLIVPALPAVLKRSPNYCHLCVPCYPGKIQGIFAILGVVGSDAPP